MEAPISVCACGITHLSVCMWKSEVDVKYLLSCAPYLFILYIIFTFIYMCLYKCTCTCHSTNVGVRVQLSGVNSLLPPCKCQWLNSGGQDCQQIPLHAEPSHLSLSYFWVRVYHWTWSSLFRIDWMARKSLGSSCLNTLAWSYGQVLLC